MYENRVLSPQPTSPSSYQKFRRFLFLTEIGLFEIVFIVVLLSLAAGILNYFNILKISKAFPVLSFLPTQHQNTQKHTLINTSSEGVSVQDYQQMETFVSNMLQRQYAGKVFTYRGLEDPAGTTKTSKILKASWTSNKIQFTGSKHFDSATQKISYFSLFISSSSGSLHEPLTQDMAQHVADTYFKPIAITKWNCGTDEVKVINDVLSICQSMQETSQGKVGYSVQISKAVPNLIVAFSCLIPKTSIAYGTMKYCKM